MELTKMTVREFADVLSSDAPAPGGGSTAALAGSLGAALTAMVCALTLGRKKYADDAIRAEYVQKKALALQEEWMAAVDSDTEAFNLVSAAYGMPKDTPEEKAARSEAIQKGLAACIESPLRMMELASEALNAAAELSEGFNDSAASDLGVSVLMLKSALLGAWLNVKINLGSLKDTDAAEAYKNCGQALLDRSLPLADELFAKIEGMM